MSNRLVISWLVIDYWRWSMSNRSPKILWPIDYSSMISITHWCNWLLIDDPSITHWLLYCTRKTAFLLSCTAFFFHLWFSSVISEVPVDDVETQSANHKNRWFLIVRYFTLPNSLFNNKTTEPTSLKMKLTSMLTRIDYVAIDFVLWVFVGKVKLLRLRETFVTSSYITSLSTEYLYKFRFFGFWAKRDSFIF